jgi:hypothetical protein
VQLGRRDGFGQAVGAATNAIPSVRFLRSHSSESALARKEV